MSKKKLDNKNIEQETALEEISPKLEETEEYRKASFGEKISLKFRKRLIVSRLYTLILVAFIIAAVVGINLWADSKNLAQIDVTKNHLHSLTETSKDQLKGLNKDVKVYVYGYTDSDDLVQFLQQYNAFNDKISYEIITESTNYELVTKYQLGTSSALIIACGDKDKIIYPDYEFSTTDSESGDSIDVAEEVITNAIIKISTDDPVKVYFATGNGEYSKDKLYALSTFLEQQVYELEDLNLLSATEIPADCDIFAILGPQEDLTETQAGLIKEYVNNGGNLLVCALTPANEDFVNLQSVLDLYGVKVNKGLLYESDSKHYLAYQNSAPLPYVLIPGYSSSNPITKDFEKASRNQMVIMPWSQSLTINDVTEENVTVTNSEIVSTSSDCYNLINYSNGINEDALKDTEKSTYTIGSELTRTVKKDEENSITSKLVIYANNTFFTDSYKDAGVQISVMNSAGNINLALNTFAELAEEESLLTIRKNANVTRFQNTESEARIVKLIIFGIPLVIILLGIIIWNYRRKKR